MENRKKMLASFILLSGVSFGLISCAADSSNQTGTQKLTFMESPNQTMAYDGIERNSTSESWAQLSEGSIELTVRGSTSCPPIVETVTKEKSNTVKVQLKETQKDVACSKDYRSSYVTIVSAGDVEDVEISTNGDGKVKVLPKR